MHLYRTEECNTSFAIFPYTVGLFSFKFQSNLLTRSHPPPPHYLWFAFVCFLIRSPPPPQPPQPPQPPGPVLHFPHRMWW